MPESIPLRSAPNHRLSNILFDADLARDPHGTGTGTANSDGNPSVRASSHYTPPVDDRPFNDLPHPTRKSEAKDKGKSVHFKEPQSPGSDVSFDDWDESAPAMPSDLRPDMDRERNSRSLSPLLRTHKNLDEGTENGPLSRSTHSFHERDPETQAHFETRRRYTYAAIFLALSLVSFTVQTETAVYIQHELKWNKAYCMLYMTHGSWVLLWPFQFLILRLQQWSTPFPTFWRRHVQLLRQTALMVQHQTLHPSVRQSQASPVRHMLRMTAMITCALTIAGGSWYVAVNLTTASDLTAIYNCSAFFAYAFSIPLLHEKVRMNKVVAVAVAIFGVFIVAYGDMKPAKGGNKSGGGAGGEKAPASHEAENRAFGNMVIGIGSVLYGLYEVLYKRLACPPDGCSPNRGMIFANTFGSLIGAFTLCVLWVPLPILHYMGWEIFELPHGKQAWMMAISVLANATFSGSFLILISLTSPVLSSVAALLTIFIVALVDQLLPPPLNSPLTPAALVGGLLIIAAFCLLAWATYWEMDEERRRKLEEESDVDE